jgi:hypothetical protein
MVAREQGRYAASPNTLRPCQAAKAWPKAGEREENGPTEPCGQHWVGLAHGFADSMRTRMARSNPYASPTGGAKTGHVPMPRTGQDNHDHVGSVECLGDDCETCLTIHSFPYWNL